MSAKPLKLNQPVGKRLRTQPRVLIIDPSTTTRFVLGELLRRSGADPVVVEESDALEQARVLSPDAVYVDADAISEATLRELADLTGRTTAAIVVAGTNRPGSPSLKGVSFVRKPYHFRDLVHKLWLSLGVGATPLQAAA